MFGTAAHNNPLVDPMAPLGWVRCCIARPSLLACQGAMSPAVQPGNVTGPALACALLRRALFGLGDGVWRGRLHFALSFFRLLLLLLLLALAFFELIVGLGHVACFLADGCSPYHQSQLAGILRGLTNQSNRRLEAVRVD